MVDLNKLSLIAFREKGDQVLSQLLAIGILTNGSDDYCDFFYSCFTSKCNFKMLP